MAGRRIEIAGDETLGLGAGARMNDVADHAGVGTSALPGRRPTA
jgi:hypothetical protein